MPAADPNHEHRSAHGTAQHSERHTHGHPILDEAQWAAMAESTEEFGELFVQFVSNSIARVNELRNPASGPIGRAIDIGSGPGVAACAFAAAFPKAEVVAADSSPAMLERAAARAERLGVSARFSTIEAELPNGLGGLGDADLVWASMALHHVGDEVAALRAMGRLLRPGGFVVVAEFPRNERRMTFITRAIDDEFPGLSDRIEAASAAWFSSMRAGLAGSTPSRSLEQMVIDAGLHVLDSRVDRVQLTAPLSTVARRALVRNIQMACSQMAEHLDESDLHALQALCDPANERGLLRHPDLSIEAARLVVVAGQSEVTS